MTSESYDYPLDLRIVHFTDYPTDAAARQKVILHYVLKAVARTRESLSWKKGKVFSFGDNGGDVQVFSTKSSNTGREGKAHWHGRVSHHTETKYESFRSGLLIDHAQQEAKYIHDIKETTKIDSLLDTVAEVWRNGYALPIVTKDRDFLQLIITIDLPAHAEPFSEAHEALITEHFTSKFPGSTPATAPVASDASLKRSFVVIQVPVEHESAPERPSDFVRGRYASVEAVYEGEKTGETIWRMYVQSDPRGSIPSWMTEMSIEGKTAQDVPMFVKWARTAKLDLPTATTNEPATPSTAAAASVEA